MNDGRAIVKVESDTFGPLDGIAEMISSVFIDLYAQGRISDMDDFAKAVGLAQGIQGKAQLCREWKAGLFAISRRGAMPASRQLSRALFPPDLPPPPPMVDLPARFRELMWVCLQIEVAIGAREHADGDWRYTLTKDGEALRVGIQLPGRYKSACWSDRRITDAQSGRQAIREAQQNYDALIEQLTRKKSRNLRSKQQ